MACTHRWQRRERGNFSGSEVTMGSARSWLGALALAVATLAHEAVAAAQAPDAPTAAGCTKDKEAAKALADQASLAGRGSADAFEKAGVAYLDVWRKYGAGPRDAGQPVVCGGLDAVLREAARSYAAAGLVGRSIAIYKMLVDPKNGMNEGEIARNSLVDMADGYEAIGVFDQAADWRERALPLDPKSPRVAEGLGAAIRLRLGLGQTDKALEDLELYEKYYGAKRAAGATELRLVVAARLVEIGDDERARKLLERSMARLDAPGAPLDARVGAHALLGRVLASLRDKGAPAEYVKVLEAWRDPDAAVASIRAIPGEDDGAREARLARALDAQGEALFFGAEALRAKRLERPAKLPDLSRARTGAEMGKKLAPWFAKRRAELAGVEKEYLRVLEVRPSAPGAWSIRAAARAGSIWADAVDQVRKAPLPKEWSGSGPVPGGAGLTWEGVRAAYLAQIDEAARPMSEAAKTAMKRCVELSRKTRIANASTRVCEAWLDDHDASEQAVGGDLLGRPDRADRRLVGKPPPSAIDGVLLYGGAK